MKTIMNIFSKNILKQAFILLSLLGLASFACAQGSLQAQVDRTKISTDETLTFTLLYNKSNLFSEPNFDLLEKNFDILSRNQSSKYQFVNGKSETSISWILSLAPKSIGVFTIPSIEFDGQKTQPIQVTVTEPQVAINSSDQPIFMEVSFDKNKIYVQEQLLMTIKLFTSISLNGLNSEEFKLENALVSKVSEHQYQTKVNGHSYGVVEVRYAIFPQQSGTLEIPSQIWTVSLQPRRPSMNDPFGGFRSQISSERKRLRTNNKSISVLAQPQTTQGQEWLPAKDLQISQTWSASPDSFIVGEPITRTIQIRTKGLMASQLPPLILGAADGVKYYPDQPQSNDDTTADGISSIRQESFAIVPNKTGSITLPAVIINWWDTDENKLVTAELPAKIIQVEASTETPATPEPIETPQPIIPEQSGNIDNEATPKADTLTPSQASIWMAISSIGLIGCLLFALLWWRTHRQLKKINQQLQQKPPSGFDYAAAKQTTDLKDLQKILTGKEVANSRELRSKLLNWAKNTLGVNSLVEITSKAPEEIKPQLQLFIQRIDAQLYGNQEQPVLTGAEKQELFNLLQKVEKSIHEKTADRASLKPLYPS